MGSYPGSKSHTFAQKLLQWPLKMRHTRTLTQDTTVCTLWLPYAVVDLVTQQYNTDIVQGLVRFSFPGFHTEKLIMGKSLGTKILAIYYRSFTQ